MQNANGSIEEEDQDDSDDNETDSDDDSSEPASTSSDVPIRGKAKWFMQGYLSFIKFMICYPLDLKLKIYILNSERF